MALNAYLLATQNLLQNPAAPTALYDSTSLTTYINTARSQIAAESECIRESVSISTSALQNTYSLSAATYGTGILAGIKIKHISINTMVLNQWPYEYLIEVLLGTSSPMQPTDWASYQAGESAFFVVFPEPNTTYTLQTDLVCLPVVLVNDSTPEAIPYPWTDAIPYYAAYMALLSSQTSTRNQEADTMFKRYEEFMSRARRGSTSSNTPFSYPQSGSISPPRPLGIQSNDKRG
jgi:hypothetical protein